MNIRNGDSVIVITGKDKGKTGTVLRVLPTTGRIVVTGINMRTKHVKATPQQAGRRLQYEASIAVSNVMVVDPKTKKRTRTGFVINEKGRKERIAKKSGEVIARAAAKPVVSKGEKKEAKSTEKTKPANKTDVQKVEKLEKKPFWKKVSFGAGEVEEAGFEGRSNTKKEEKDRSVPDQGQTPDTFSHQRGK